MYVFSRPRLLNFVSDASFVYSRSEVEDNYIPNSSSYLFSSKNSIQVPIGALPHTSFSLPLAPARALPLPPTEAPLEHLKFFHRTSLAQITFLAAFLAHATLYDVSRTCPGIGGVPPVRRRDGGVRRQLRW